MCQISFEMLFSYNFWHNISLPWQQTFCHYWKCVLHIYTSRPTCIPNCIWIALEIVVFHVFWNMLLPWQRTFCHCPKMCHAHLHFKANMCAKSNLKMLFPTIFGIICRYQGNTHSATVQKCVMHIWKSHAHLLCARVALPVKRVKQVLKTTSCDWIIVWKRWKFFKTFAQLLNIWNVFFKIIPNLPVFVERKELHFWVEKKLWRVRCLCSFLG